MIKSPDLRNGRDKRRCNQPLLSVFVNLGLLVSLGEGVKDSLRGVVSLLKLPLELSADVEVDGVVAVGCFETGRTTRVSKSTDTCSIKVTFVLSPYKFIHWYLTIS